MSPGDQTIIGHLKHDGWLKRSHLKAYKSSCTIHNSDMRLIFTLLDLQAGKSNGTRLVAFIRQVALSGFHP